MSLKKEAAVFAPAVKTKYNLDDPRDYEEIAEYRRQFNAFKMPERPACTHTGFDLCNPKTLFKQFWWMRHLGIIEFDGRDVQVKNGKRLEYEEHQCNWNALQELRYQDTKKRIAAMGQEERVEYDRKFKERSDGIRKMLKVVTESMEMPKVADAPVQKEPSKLDAFLGPEESMELPTPILDYQDDEIDIKDIPF